MHPRMLYARARRCQRVFFSIFLGLCLRIFLRRFLITEPKLAPACVQYSWMGKRRPEWPRASYRTAGSPVGDATELRKEGYADDAVQGRIDRGRGRARSA